ncbi:MAG: aminodeoxychorismate/anthranilate synthase component II [Planctomycetes bacterium]|nr:aminodeoxychorismate/anthranilate synthase component II [Planctomycetota bacterium]
MIILIDNYDSFTYNLVQRLGEIGLADAALRHEIAVYRNDEITVDQIAEKKPTHLIISPGPCTPLEGGISNDAIQFFHDKIPVLGVCLGHQCIGHTFGATVDRAPRIMHGKTSEIRHDGRTLYAGLSNPFTATRYHSLIILRDTLSAEFEISAWTEEGEIMGVRHKTHRLEGVQFHPESFLTVEGTRLLANFLKLSD